VKSEVSDEVTMGSFGGFPNGCGLAGPLPSPRHAIYERLAEIRFIHDRLAH